MFAAPKLERVRVGVVGIGGRGGAAVERLLLIPGVELTAVCDIQDSMLAKARTACDKAGVRRAKEYTGSVEAWKGLCDDPNVDVVYNTTPWWLHAPVALYAMRAGKHAMNEVPGATTVDECWDLVETSEKTSRHCMQLENCCYGEFELLALNLARQGFFGQVVHGECAYIHDLTRGQLKGYWDNWRLKWNMRHKGNAYPTHGLGPVCNVMDVNRGDRLDYLVSLESDQFNVEEKAKALFPAEAWQRKAKVAMGDMNSTLIRTVKGRSILVQHDVSSPRPYTRINLIQGTRGILCGGDEADLTNGWPYRIGQEKGPATGCHTFFDGVTAEEIRQTHKHPLWKKYGVQAKEEGGHGGMDYLMDLRWSICLREGLPLDMNVYDLATLSSICELSERSVRNRSAAQDIPDFTRGGWKTAPQVAFA